MATASFSTAPPSATETAQEDASKIPPKAPPKSSEPVLPDASAQDGATDLSRSYSGLSVQPFSKEAASVLMAPIDPLSIEIKPGKW